jgi:hypothetical protein
MKKSTKSLVAFALGSLFAASLAFAAASTAKVESKEAGCCIKSAKNGETCAHACCVEAAKDGMNCTKCKGVGPLKKKKKKAA